jgi:agmatine deiminase
MNKTAQLKLAPELLMVTRRLPAEWEPQDGVLVAWPHHKSDWQPYLDQAESVFAEVIAQISRFEQVLVVAPDALLVSDRLRQSAACLENVRIYPGPTNDTWARDFGPITVAEAGKPVLLDFGFNGWGLKFAANLDNQITRRLEDDGAFAVARRTMGLILEGGSIESDGQGTILTTAECLLNPNRNPQLTQLELEAQLATLFGADQILWLESGYLAGDDTDSHVDTLARLCPDNTILYVACDDPQDEHHSALNAMAEELRQFRTRDGEPYRLLPLPWPTAMYDPEGERLPATYANFLIINGAVLVPTYGAPQDTVALAVVQQAFPGRQIIGVDCRTLILQHGSLHCVTMQLPKGVLS